jgi:hypothetical protein
MILSSLLAKEPEDVAFWATRALPCSEVSSLISMPLLTKLMLEHASPRVRVAAIKALSRYGVEKVRPISYFLIKRLS